MQPCRLLLPTVLVALLVGCRDETPSSPTAEGMTTPDGLPATLVGAPNTWEKVASAPTARYFTVAGSAVNVNGRSILYLFGGANLDEGDNGIATVEAYNIAVDRWAPKASMPTGVGSANGVGLIDGKLYVPGGSTYTGDGDLHLRILQIYDPAANAWTRGADMPAASGAGVSAVIGNRLYVLTGRDNAENGCVDCGSVLTRQVFRYNAMQNRWARLKPSPNYHLEGVAAAINGKLYVTGGFGPGGATRALDIYDPATNRWTSGAALPGVHTGGVGVSLAGQFYVIGGFTGEVVAYNPKTNRWVRKASFPVPTARFMAGAKVTHAGKTRIVVHVGLEDGFPDNGQGTFVYTP